jgi:hypothetical protein
MSEKAHERAFRRWFLLRVDPATEKWDPSENYVTDEEHEIALAESWLSYGFPQKGDSERP